MKKALLLGIAGSFFFAFTFLLNRSMNLSGGNWIWSASLRYLFMLPLLALLVRRRYPLKHVHRIIRKSPGYWLLWSTVGFGLFYAPLTYAGDYGESWLIAASWQMTIVMGLLLSPFFRQRIPFMNLLASALILLGVFLLQFHRLSGTDLRLTLFTLLPILIAAISYPLGNRKMMALENTGLSTLDRTYGMTLCSLPFWIMLFVWGLFQEGLPSAGQAFQSLLVALFSGVAATLLFFKATDLVKNNHCRLAVIESTQSGEVLFTLLGGIWFLRDPSPDSMGFLGIFLIISGMIWNSCQSGISRKKE